MDIRSPTLERAIRRPRQIDLRAVPSLLVTTAAIGGMLRYANSFAATRPLLIVTRVLSVGAILNRRRSGGLADPGR